MKIDVYTKLVLTVIAVCLFNIAFRDVNVVSTAHAQDHGGEKIVPVNIVQIDGEKFRSNRAGNYNRTLPVSVVER